MSKDFLREYLAEDAEFQSMGEQQQNDLIDLLATNAAARDDLFADEPEYEQMKADIDKMFIGGGSSAAGSDFVADTMASFAEPATLSTPSPVMEAGAKRIIGGLAESAASLLQSTAELGPDIIEPASVTAPAPKSGEPILDLLDKDPFWNALGEEPKDLKPEEMEPYVIRGLASIRDWGKQRQAEAAQTMAGYSVPEQFAFETTVGVLEELPALAASLYTGSWVPALGFAVVRAFGQKYGQVREAGYDPTFSAGVAGVSAAPAAIAASVGMKNTLSLGAPMLKRLGNSLAIDAFGGITQTGGSLLIDHVIDKLVRQSEQKLLPPDMSFEQGLKLTLWNTAANMAGGLVTTTIPELHARIKADLNGYKFLDLPDNQTAVVPKDVAGDVESVIRNSLKADPTQDAQRVADETVFVERQTAQYWENIARIKAQQAQQHLADKPDFQMGPQQYTGKLAEGTDVGIHPRALDADRPLSEARPGKLVKVYKADGVEYADVQIGNGELVRRVKLTDLTQPPKPAFNRGPESIEAPHFAEFMRNVMMPDIDWQSMTGDQARAALGGFYRTIFGQLKKGALAKSGGRERPYGAMVWDAAGADPDNAFRIATHEFGHFLADAPAETLKKMNLDGFETLKDIIDNEESFNKFLGNPEDTNLLKLEMNDWWDRWAMYDDGKTKYTFDPKTGQASGGNGRELRANAVSLFLNKALLTEPDLVGGGPDQPVNFRDSRTHALIQKAINSNEKIKNAYDRMMAQVGTPEGSWLATTRRALDLADQADREAIARRQVPISQSIWDFFKEQGVNKYQAWIRAAKDGANINDIIDSQALSNGFDTEYTRVAAGKILDVLKEKNIDVKDFSSYVLADRVEYDRQKAIRFLRVDKFGEKRFESMDDYQIQRAVMEQIIRQETLKQDPDISAADLQAEVNQTLKDWEGEALIEDFIDLRNPNGMSKRGAKSLKLDLQKKYGDSILELFDALWQSQHEAANKYIFPILEESGTYPPDVIAHMRDNSHYAFFDIVHHKFHTDRRRKYAETGYSKYYREQFGTEGLTKDPFAGTIEHRIKMSIAARREKFLHDMIKAVTDEKNLGSDKYIVPVPEGERPNVLPYQELVKVQQYDKTTGRMKTEQYLVNKDMMSAFDAGMTGSAFLRSWSNLNNYLKGWMTVYNPGFWVTNFLRDSARSALNLPGLEALFNPIEAIKEGYEEYKHQKAGTMNPLREEMLKKNLLLNGMNWIENSPTDTAIKKLAKAVNRNLPEAQMAWKEVDSLAQFGAFLMQKAKSGKAAYEEFATRMNTVSEFSTKAAAYKYLNKLLERKEITEFERNWYVRNAVGTPLLMKQGKLNPLLSNLLLFYNPSMQGLLADAEVAARDYKARRLSSSIVKRLMIAIPYQLGVAAALSGFFGGDMKDAAERVPIPAWSRGLSIPVGITNQGKAAYTFLPFDQTTAAINSAVFLTIQSMRNFGSKESYTASALTQKLLEGAFEQGGELLPSISPAIKFPFYDVPTVMSGGNIRAHSGQFILPRRYENTSNVGKRVEALATHMWNTGWSGPVGLIARIPYDDYRERPMGTGKSGALTSLDQMMDWAPGARPMIGRFVKFSDVGHSQWSEMREAPVVEAHQERKNAYYEEAIQAFANGDSAARTRLAGMVRELGRDYENRNVDKSIARMIIKIANDVQRMDTAAQKDPLLPAHLRGILTANSRDVREMRLQELKKHLDRRR